MEPTTFDTRWARFLDASEALRRPLHWPGEATDLPFDEAMLIDVLRAGPRALAAGMSLQVLAGGGEREDHRERVLVTPPCEGEALAEWLARLFPGEAVGIKLGRLEVLAGPIARAAVRLLAPVLSRVGTPSAGASIGAFIGAYGLTPFGIHNDPMTHIFHVHVQGTKVVRLWSAEAYRRVREDLSYCYHVTPAELETADDRFVLGPGSLMSFPGERHHIGASFEPTIAVSLVLDHHCRRDILAAACAEPLRRALGPGADAPCGPLEAPLAIEAFDDEPPATAREWLGRALEAHRRRLRERGGLERPASLALPSTHASTLHSTPASTLPSEE